jgi:hypothetical protein
MGPVGRGVLVVSLWGWDGRVVVMAILFSGGMDCGGLALMTIAIPGRDRPGHLARVGSGAGEKRRVRRAFCQLPLGQEHSANRTDSR